MTECESGQAYESERVNVGNSIKITMSGRVIEHG